MVLKSRATLFSLIKKNYINIAHLFQFYNNKYIQIKNILFVFVPIIHNTMEGKQTNIIFAKNVEYVT